MSNKQELKVFTFNESNQPIRVEVIKGEPWFVAKDVCDALTVENSRKATASLDDDEKGASPIVTPSGTQQMTIVNESGLYNLIFQSRKPEAKKFRKWVTMEVLPSIRKTGRYEAAGQNVLNVSGGSNVSAVSVRSRRATGAELLNAEILNLLWLIDESLNLGDRRDVALELGVSRVTVSRVLSGHVRNARVLMALYQKAKANRACGMLYYNPSLMASRLMDGEPVCDADYVRSVLPPVVYGDKKRGGQPGNQNARKHWRKEGE
ncbi:MAG: LacI family DNA-binding transcriptional regulator [Bacteroidaceae bacterium]|nr:LacI family DNA-binding transcriptional regulator [Bacteroidaceae bacterium]